MALKKLGFAFCAWLFVHSVGLVAANAETVEVMENIYTIVHGEGIDSNTTFIVTREGVIVIDTRVSPAEARKVMQEIRKVTDLPIRYTINTHYHGDHTFGNQVFADTKTIIAHENVRKSLVGSLGRDHLEKFKSFKIPGLDEVTVTPPNLVFEKKMHIYLGGYHLELIHFGRGHTDGDIFIYMNALKTVITGDLVFNENHPYMGDGYVEEWIATLQFIEDIENEVIIPGHGPVGGKPIVIAMKHYLLDLKSRVKAQLEAGKGLEETVEAVRQGMLKKYKHWGKKNNLDNNIKRTFLELSLKESS